MEEERLKAALAMLKVDLGIVSEAYDERLRQYIQTAAAQITKEGVTLYGTLPDLQLVVMYAAWMWRRRDSMEGMPRMLRYQLNNRIFTERMGDSYG